MNTFLQILFLCCLFSSFTHSQFSDNFNDGDFTTNPTWSGDSEKFRVNEVFQLQLDDSDSGTATLYTPYTVSSDFVWEIELVLDFAPSSNNNFSCYFMIDNQDPSIANGYFFTIGENLANDNIKIFSLSDGVPSASPLAEGELGALSEKPAILKLRIERIENSFSVFTAYETIDIPSFEIAFFDETFDFIQDAFWVLNPKYTSSNSTGFTFDNIVAKEFEPDMTPPKLTKFEIISANQLELTFDEVLELGTISSSNFGLDPNITLSTIDFTSTNNNRILLSYDENFSSGINYQLSTSGITDLNGNAIVPFSNFFSVSEAPEKGDLVINEILFNPLTGGSDYIEIMNVSDKLLNLEGVKIVNADKQDESTIEGDILLEPGDIIAISEDTSSTIEDYLPTDYYLIKNNLPAFNLDMGNVSIALPNDTILDSFDYTEDMHLSLLDDNKGVSLERIFPNSASVEENFTSGVASTNFGTPGYENANFNDGEIIFDELLIIENDVLSPNGDGDDDQLIMFLNFPDNSYIASIDIYNIQGQKIKSVINNQLSAPRDIVRWDGTMDDGGKANIGHYIVVLKAFREDGSTVNDKKHVKLLDFF